MCSQTRLAKRKKNKCLHFQHVSDQCNFETKQAARHNTHHHGIHTSQEYGNVDSPNVFSLIASLETGRHCGHRVAKTSWRSTLGEPMPVFTSIPARPQAQHISATSSYISNSKYTGDRSDVDSATIALHFSSKHNGKTPNN